MNKDEDLIHEKITVPDEKPRTSRPRLLNLLAEDLTAYNATIIHGRAGTGKTTLVADFARRAARPVCWYKVDAADGGLSVFCRYLAATLSLQRPSINVEPIAANYRHGGKRPAPSFWLRLLSSNWANRPASRCFW